MVEGKEKGWIRGRSKEGKMKEGGLGIRKADEGGCKV